MRPYAPLTIELAADEHIVAVVPRDEGGPGSRWTNALAWVYIVDNQSGYRVVAIHYDEMTPELKALLASGEAVTAALILAVPIVKKANPTGDSHA